jgi:hypothetical protein
MTFCCLRCGSEGKDTCLHNRSLYTCTCLLFASLSECLNHCAFDLDMAAFYGGQCPLSICIL